MAVLFSWWAWAAAALVFAILETLVPVFFFLGLSAGAALVAVLLALGAGFSASLPWLLVVFAGVSLAGTVALRLVLGGKKSDTKTFTDDINQG